MAEQLTNRERVKEIVSGIEQNIQKLFQNGRYLDYLRTMAQFHSYSTTNTILIHMQRPQAASPVAGFHKWRQFGRHVKKGERGLTIIAPTPLKKKIEEARLDPDTRAPVLDQDGNIIIDEKTIEIPLFKPVKVFSADQTEGAPLPSLSTDLTGDVRHHEAFMEALRRASPMPIEFAPLEPGIAGRCVYSRQVILIQEGMGQVRTVRAAVHEIGHALLHNREKGHMSALPENMDKELPRAKDRRTREVEAESVSYAVCQYYHIDTSASSMDYIASWSKDKSLPELKASLETITKTVNGLIAAIDKHFAEICRERGVDLTASELSAPEERDTPEKYVGDFFAHLEELYAAGLIPAPHPSSERDNFERIFLRYLREGNFDSFRYVLKDAEKRANMPATAVLHDRLEKMSDQWDAALVCKVEPISLSGSTADRRAIQTYQMQDNRLIPYKPVFVGTVAECQRVMAGLETGTITLRDVRQPGFEPPAAPEPRFIYLMDANPEMEASDGQHYIEAYEKTALGELKLNQMLFAGTADVCAGLLEQLQNGALQYESFFIVRAARVSYFTAEDGGELDALVGADDKVYLGRRDHYDNRGHYLNNDQSLIHISDNENVFDVISGSGPSYTQDQLRETGYFAPEEWERFAALPIHADTELEQAVPSTPEPVQSGQPEMPWWDTELDQYPVPDSSCILEDFSKSGYGPEYADLLPLSIDRAAELLDRDFTIYLTSHTGEPTMIFDRSELENDSSTCIFAVPREEWEESPDFQQAVADRMHRQEEREEAFLGHRGDCFAIYQVRNDPALRDIRFESLDQLKSIGRTAERGNYNLIYTAPLPAAESVETVLDQLWTQFNNDRPPDYQSPSMSVSDIIAIKRAGVLSCHYCDSFGFQQLANFIQPDNYMKNAEMQIEDDYNMLDGIINNGPKVTAAELERQARSGHPISLVDLAGADRREKSSVLSRLNAAQPQGKKKAQKKGVGKER